MMWVVRNPNEVGARFLFSTCGILLILLFPPLRSLAAWEAFFQDGMCGRHCKPYENTNHHFFLSL
jgi:hypothetical protein